MDGAARQVLERTLANLEAAAAEIRAQLGDIDGDRENAVDLSAVSPLGPDWITPKQYAGMADAAQTQRSTA